MPKLIDLTGQRFGRLTVVSRADDVFTSGGNRKVTWMCICDCGKRVVVLSANLRNGHTKSCGCISAEILQKRNVVHGYCYSKLYEVWKGMKARCLNPTHMYYENYGGRGVEVCEEWEQDFLVFRDWAIENGYQEGLTIDRKDGAKGYTPENCRWVPMKTQNNNKRNNHLISFRGETHTLAEWAEITGINRSAITDRLVRGWPLERVLTEPVHAKFRNK